MLRAIAIGLALMTLSACETAKGFTRDIQKAGNAIGGVAADIERKL